ncbi:M14 family zinc carboxypeptidase [Spirosoma oryzicola]|uniref:M14 family zinc carboxypeptidase n=1 Tax=Spirosoma oryzicola TaxID=2898794 RepID=UPI001E4E1C0A|nr:M14 family zinc carboxypeptidase [Spirosoma oryzicola]UHG91259.1 peptidase M14 [Spirosoma oryzicola]
MTSIASQDQTIARRLHDAHDTYKEQTLLHRRFKHKDIVPLLNSLSGQTPFEVSQIGESLEKRSIHQVKAGTGTHKVLLWSQMHGDEATATMALFDIFNFLKASDDGFDDFREVVLANTTLYFVPMLNPDGAERFQRRTATDIDMNRDALRLQTPEGALLKKLQQTLQPLVGFNLHDQNPRYSVGKTGKQAVMSFLATAYNEERNVNEVRERSMQLIVGMNQVVQQFVPGQVGRFDDEFEPRAFGDNIQKWGTTLVLVESGGYKGDVEKMIIRRLNFVAILTALKAIADGSYKREDTADYQRIPENGRLLFDVLIRNATVVREGQAVTVDVGIFHNEINTSNGGFRYKSVIDDIGDLSTFHGLNEIDATGLTLVPAHVYAEPLNSAADLQQLDAVSLRREGISVFKVRQKPDDWYPQHPVHLLYEGDLPAQPLAIDQIPTFLLLKDNQIIYQFVNGFWGDTIDESGKRCNGIAE